ncbi:MAG: hypothetical protein IT426_13680 [Pirellulales bacterium]|nr:hypothetical protein [Pirellulales bacterium]
MRISLEARLDRSFDETFAKVRRRWPVSTAGSEFEELARREWDRAAAQEAAEAAAALMPTIPSHVRAQLSVDPSSALGRLIANRRLAESASGLLAVALTDHE